MHNREELIVWLTHYNNRFGSAGSEGLINLQALPKPGPSWGPLGYADNVERLEDPSLYETDRVIHAAIKELAHERWALYMVLRNAYLDADTSPSIVEKWRMGKEAGGLGEKLQFDMHEDAVKWLLERIEKQAGDDFCIVNSPKLQVARGDLDAARQRRRQRARLKFFDYEGEHGTEEAVKLVAKECDYSRKEVYKIISGRKGHKKKK